MGDGFYVRRDEHRVASTPHTRGPWDPGAQHGGPPAALLGSACESAMRLPVARLTLEILRPIPIAELTLDVQLRRPGRSIELVEGELADDDGPVMLARAWGIREADLAADVAVQDPAPALPDVAEAVDEPLWEGWEDGGWGRAMDIRFVSGTSFERDGPARAWFRPRVPLVADEPLTPLQRVLLAADAGNGISSAIDIRRWVFINTELTVHLHRHPAGEWVGLDATSSYERTGVGLAASVLHDEHGPIGRGAQALFVGEQRSG